MLRPMGTALRSLRSRSSLSGRRLRPGPLALLALLSSLGACGSSPAPRKASDAEGDGKHEAKADGKHEAKADAKAAAPQAAGWSWDLPAGLKAPPVPADNPMDAAKVALGRRLFLDRRLSVDSSRSCYSCHLDEHGNADGRAKAVGAKDKPLPRNSPTIWNVAYRTSLYWDGRAPSLEKQAVGALKGGNMGLGDTLEAHMAKVGALPEYAGVFREVFGLEADAPVTSRHVAQAIAAYERTLLCGGTAHDQGKLPEAAARGWALFTGKAGCISCHTGQDLTDEAFHNVGVGVPKDGKVAEGVDRGRGKVTGRAEDDFKFRTPTLRNVSRTAPYFHDGSVASLEEAVRLMAGGGVAGAPGRDPLLQDRKLSDAEVRDIVAFLETLTCDGKIGPSAQPPVPGGPG